MYSQREKALKHSYEQMQHEFDTVRREYSTLMMNNGVLVDENARLRAQVRLLFLSFKMNNVFDDEFCLDCIVECDEWTSNNRNASVTIVMR